MLDVRFSSFSKKFLKKSEIDITERILGKIEELRENPFPSDTKRVKGKKDKIFRIRVGKYRIQYNVFHKQNFIFISDIDKKRKSLQKLK
jgi:mRNA interferase RelE/StbE